MRFLDFELLRCLHREDLEYESEHLISPTVPDFSQIVLTTTTFPSILQPPPFSSKSTKLEHAVESNITYNPVVQVQSIKPVLGRETILVEEKKDEKDNKDHKGGNKKKKGVFSKLLGYKIKRIKETYSNIKKFLFL